MEAAVRKATRLDYNPPKQKHLQTLINLTFQSPGNAASIIDILDKRLRENSWIIIFKVLIIIHTLMKLGDGEKVISYVETKPSALDTSKLREKSSGVVHIQNIYLYTAYLEQRVIAYRHLRVDYVKKTMGGKEGRLRRLPVKDGLLKETIVLQKQIGTLLKSNFILEDVDSGISLYAYGLLVEDLVILFQVINESIVNILEHYFTMDKEDARTSLEIYKKFAKQTEDTSVFLDRARRLQNDLSMTIPTVKHAPLSLAAALQEYLDNTNEISSNSKPSLEHSNTAEPTAAPQDNNTITFNAQTRQPKELTDFFASLENETVTIYNNQQQQLIPVISSQPTGHNPFRTNTPPNASVQQPFVALPQQPMLPTLTTSNQQVNPFRASTMPQMNTPFSSTLALQPPLLTPQPQQSLSSNPFTLSTQQQQPTIMVAAPTPLNNKNPFHNTANNKQQQPWGNSSIF
ncbi:ANTH domain-containing protein [Parasitella parasitica]|nr:ANTH domain-containing protein [Parasitella parasitica]